MADLKQIWAVTTPGVSYPSTLDLIDTSTNSVTQAVAGGLLPFAFTPDDKFAYYWTNNMEYSITSLETQQIVGSLSVPSAYYSAIGFLPAH